MSRPYRCFHCQESFRGADAALHFGSRDGDRPACLMRQPGEYHLLKVLRSAHDELAVYRSEDTELHRALHSMSADHAQALLREEEKGYARGVSDMRAENSLLRSWLAEGPDADAILERRINAELRASAGGSDGRTE